jgi:magnesium and cobalt exporter, CNNM family
MTMLMVTATATLTISFFCSICEAALFAVDDLWVDHLVEQNSTGGHRLHRLRDDIDLPIAAILTLNTISHTVGATLAGSLAALHFDSIGVGIFSVGFTLSILYISEIIPKTLGVLYAEKLAPILATPIDWMITILWPLVWTCKIITGLFPRPSGLESLSEDHLLSMAKRGLSDGTLRPDEARWLQNALELDRIKVVDVITPRTVIFSLPHDMTIGEACHESPHWSHTRVPLTEQGDLDKITGFVMRHEAFEAVVAGKGNQPLSTISRDITVVPATVSVSDVLTRFLRERQHMFIVADEFGGTEGVVTLEDALEALLGSDIVDETDRDANLQRVARFRAKQKFRQDPARQNPPQ